MSLSLSRRRLLAQAATLGCLLPLPTRLWAASPALRLTASRRVIEVKGRAASVYGLTQTDGTAGLMLDPGARFAVTLANQLDQPTIIHWHGQTPPPDQDGVVATGYVAAIAPGSTAAYDFAARPGTHWMHAHYGLQEQALLAAPLIVRSAADAALDAQEVTVLFHDFSFRPPEDILASLTGSPAMTHGTMDHSQMTPGTMAGMMNADLNDVDYDAYLANDRTLDDPQVVRTERRGRIRLRLINGATATAFWIDFGGTSGTVIAADGNPVVPVKTTRVPLAQGQRLDILLDMPPDGAALPVFAQREGDTIRTGLVLAPPGGVITKQTEQAVAPAPALDWSLESRLQAANGGSAPATRRLQLELTGTMMPYNWALNGRSWGRHQPLQVTSGEQVEIEMVNRTMMAHPMHLHGHHFFVTALNGTPVTGALRDTVLVPAMATVTVSLAADNPGRWLLHCHNLFHMATGMMTELVYAGA